MNTSITELTEKVASQAAQIPSMYGRVDFSITPERFAVAARRPDRACSGVCAAAPGTARQ